MHSSEPIAGPPDGVATDAFGAVDEVSDLRHIRINRRNPLAKDVVIRIMYCGICHTDLHIVKNEWKNACYPVIPGHEITGVVDKVGAETTRFKAGDKCGVGFYVDTCGECKQLTEHECRSTHFNGRNLSRSPARKRYYNTVFVKGHYQNIQKSAKSNVAMYKESKMEQYCEEGIVIAFNSPDKRNENDGCRTCGGYSKRIVVNERFVFRWPDTLSMESGTPLLCAGITVYSPLKHLYRTRSSDGGQFSVAVIGLGGLGHIAIPLARAMGAHVTAISRKVSESKGKLALDLGAHEYLTIESLASKGCDKRFDLILDTVSVDHSLDDFLCLLKLDGTLVTIGLPGEPMRFRARDLITGRRSIIGSVVGSLEETQEMLYFCADNNITCMTEIITIDQINKAYDRLVKGDVKFRFVIDITNSNW